MKAYEIPISKAALKMLKRDFGYKGVMNLHGLHLTRTKSDTEQWHEYLNRLEPHQAKITVICRYASPGRLYTLAQTIEHTFNSTFLLYVASAVEHGMAAAEAIQRFVDKYDLSEEDFKEETAYKRWQRFQKKEKKRELIPLW
jgi:hypothetical protein